MPHAIFQRPLEQANSASCNMTRALLPELMRCVELPVSRQNSDLDCRYRMPYRQVVYQVAFGQLSPDCERNWLASFSGYGR